MNQSAQILAEQSARKMFDDDRASQALGMRIVAVRPGYAKLTMTVRNDMTNGHSTCHGGFIFSLADSAFAFACNSYNQRTVAAGCLIDFLAPAQAGDELTAEAAEQALAGRSGVYDVAVTNQHGVRIALFRGRSRQVGGEIVVSK
ncbi:MAG TPA: hydroxyphenylacetyl-CoA thioesterase PaaI [Bryobacteraceae bacterium]|nr:hydroxyphenylacetyl-CoA thioesterase PaaI [Bryobacteraceae bacterium]